VSAGPGAWRRSLMAAKLALLAAMLPACSSPGIREDVPRPPASHALPPAADGVLARLSAEVTSAGGPGVSAFRLLDSSVDALRWRLALIDTAVSSLDIQTYLWYPDVAGRLILERAVLAAQRGVHVRLVVDDLLTIGQDQLIADLDSQPNIELRLFNPWSDRGMLWRAAEMIGEMERLNTRMHDKLLIVDGHATILGGRNIGDHYFGLSHDYNFHDLDVLGFGPVAEQANELFDTFWNSDALVSAASLTTEPDREEAKAAWDRIRRLNREAPELESFPREPRDWSEDFVNVRGELSIGSSEIVFDAAETGGAGQAMIGTMFSLFSRATRELLITNAYVIPGEPAIDFLRGLSDRGVDIRILTNSLASHDVPAVNSHYEGWRDDLINAGVDLYEFRPDPAIASIVAVPPASSKFTGLHTKAAVVDRRYVFVGSMNLDPRSANINTEMGVIIDSPELAADLSTLMRRDMQGENSWRVVLGRNGKPYWISSDGTLSRQPSRGATQNIMNVLFKVLPKELY